MKKNEYKTNVIIVTTRFNVAPVADKTGKLTIEITKMQINYTISLITIILTCFYSLAKIPKRELAINPAKKHPIVRVKV